MRRLEDSILKESLNTALATLEKEDIKRIVTNQQILSDQQGQLLSEDREDEANELIQKVKGQLYLFTEEFFPSSFVLNTTINEVISAEDEKLLLESSYKFNLLPPKAKKT